MPALLDAITTTSRDMFYCILASKLPIKKKQKPPDHKISEKRKLANHFFLLGLNEVSNIVYLQPLWEKAASVIPCFLSYQLEQ